MSTPNLVVQSTGAGVQSTAIALLIADGSLPTPDAAIFADTGWEPKAVYEQVDRLAALYESIGVAFYCVSNGNLRRDAIDPEHRYASIPYFVLNPPGEVPILVTCMWCGGSGEVVVEGKASDGLDHWAVDQCARCHGSGTVPEPNGATRALRQNEREGMGRRQCTSEYKLAPITRKIRELLGATPPDFRRVAKGLVAEQWVGFSTDEVIRANRRKDSRGVQYLTTRYPLLDLGMSRDDCTALLAERGWGHTVKSACIGCPYHGNAQWRDLRDNHPEEWADAVEFDAAIRKGGSRGLPLDGQAFLHRSRVPLELAPIDRPTRGEIAASQTSLLDVIEDGEPNGCSPYGCRTDGAA